MITQVARHRQEGDQQIPVTYGEAIIEHVAVGQPLERACLAAGVAASTRCSWQVRGTRARDAQARGEEVPESEQPYLDFVDGLERARAQSELTRLANIRRAAQRQQVIRTTERSELRMVGGREVMVVVERTVVTEEKPGSWQADAWYLERQLPADYARRVEVSGPGGDPIPIESRATSLAEAAESWLNQQEEAANDG